MNGFLSFSDYVYSCSGDTSQFACLSNLHHSSERKSEEENGSGSEGKQNGKCRREGEGSYSA